MIAFSLRQIQYERIEKARTQLLWRESAAQDPWFPLGVPRTLDIDSPCDRNMRDGCPVFSYSVKVLTRDNWVWSSLLWDSPWAVNKTPLSEEVVTEEDHVGLLVLPGSFHIPVQ